MSFLGETDISCIQLMPLHGFISGNLNKKLKPAVCKTSELSDSLRSFQVSSSKWIQLMLSLFVEVPLCETADYFMSFYFFIKLPFTHSR